MDWTWRARRWGVALTMHNERMGRVPGCARGWSARLRAERAIPVDDSQHMALAARLTKAVSEEMSFPVKVSIVEGRIILSGTADSEEGRAAAEETVEDLLPGMPIQNNLTVAKGTIIETEDRYDDKDRPGDTSPPPGSTSIEAQENSDLDPGFTDLPLETNALDVADDSVPDLEEPVEPDPAYFAPTDPVVEPNERGDIEVVGGFTPTSDTSVEVDLSVEDHQPGDEAIADAVRRELREDAETTDLPIRVVVVNGVVHLHGKVSSLEDAEAAEDVASRVPGVREVLEELELPGP